jgi:acetyltransferase-like isoleucine patch superfamily enzyme
MAMGFYSTIHGPGRERIKSALRHFFPPVLWNVMPPRPGPPAPPVHAISPDLHQIGANSEVQGLVDRRLNGRGRLVVGQNSLMRGSIVLELDASEVRIGNNSLVLFGTIIDCVESIVIEDDVLISYLCVVTDSDGHSIRLSERIHDLQLWRTNRFEFTHAKRAPVRICRGAWIGAHSIILKGVRIGCGAIVGAGSVVTRDVPDWTVVAGNPARVVKELPESER